MAFVEVAANTLDDAYSIENSVRFNVGDSPHLEITPSSTGDEQKWTFSTWVKRCGVTSSNDLVLIGAFTTNSDNQCGIVLRGTGDNCKLQSFCAISGTANNGYNFETSQVFRDPAAWYHIVIATDTTQSTNTNGIKFYVNGSQITSFGATTYNQNINTQFNTASSKMQVGARASDDAQELDGYLADTYWIDGSQLTASDFGKTDSNGVWIPKKASPTFGTNGFKLEYQQTGTSANASGIGADTSGNGNHLTPTNLAATDITTDTPTNNFATLNPLSNSLQASYSEGNLDEACNDNYGVGATQAFANGKWYWEVKIKAGDNNLVGIANADEQDRFTTVFGINNYSLTVYGVNGMIIREGSNVEDVNDTYGANDIVGVAVDMDSGTRTVQFYKNGSAFGSAATLPTNWGFTLPMIRKGGSSQTSSFNFGNPAFSISSGNADENGYGNFEYSVPSGFYALCTKNLAEFG